MSFPFRNKPSLRDRLRGKSGDEIIKELRQELSQDRKMFFDNPNWGSSTASSTFSRRFQPEEDEGMMQGRGKLEAQLDRIAERHPELADELREWRREPERERLRNTVPDMSSQPEERGQRARSAPPQPFAATRGEVDPREQHTEEPPQREPKVRHIPIYVEDRDEIILPKEATEQPIPAHAPQQPKVASTTHPIPVPPPQQPIPAPPPQQPIPAPAPQQPIPAPAPQQPIPAPAPQQPIPAPAPQSPIPAPPPQHPIPLQEPKQGPAGERSDSQDATRQSEAQPGNCALEMIARVQEEVGELRGRIDAYQGGTRADREYVYLDEMLTRNLLKLDDVETEGREEVRNSRRNAIQAVQRCISILDSKTKTEPATS